MQDKWHSAPNKAPGTGLCAVRPDYFPESPGDSAPAYRIGVIAARDRAVLLADTAAMSI